MRYSELAYEAGRAMVFLIVFWALAYILLTLSGV